MLRGAAGRDCIGQLDFVELLIAPQAHQQGLGACIFKTGQQHQHLYGLTGLNAMAGAEIFNAALVRGG